MTFLLGDDDKFQRKEQSHQVIPGRNSYLQPFCSVIQSSIFAAVLG
jgi:hypothetical protein